MKTYRLTPIAALAFLSTLTVQLLSAPLGTAFTYQGCLTEGGQPATGLYDLRFTIHDTASGGPGIAGLITNSAAGVTNGLFTVVLDFGESVFTGEARWLEIGVRASGSGDFTSLTPRQPLTPAPYAVYAPSAGVATTAGSAGSVAAANVTGTMALAQLPTVIVTNNGGGVNLTGSFAGSGAGVTNVNLMTANSQGAIGWTTNWGNFILHSSPGVGGNPRCVAAADVNGDGKMDLVSANVGTNTVTVLTNNGNGDFLTGSTPVVGNAPHSVVVTDVNGDGRVDLISANANDNTLTVLTNNGSGSFGSNATLNVGSYPASVVAADVNGDGALDLISANVGGNTLTVLTNDGNGGWFTASTLGVGYGPNYVAAVDVNADGKVDLVSANGGDSALTVLTNDGSGNFVTASSPGVGHSPRSVAVADVNGDGKVDLISANGWDNGDGIYRLTVLTNDAVGGFVTASSPVVGDAPMTVIAADITEDGRPDLICANFYDNTLSVLANNGSGGFVTAATLAAGANPQWVVAADVNSDGHLDLISADYGGNTLSVLFNAPSSYQAHFVGNGAGLTGLSVPATSLTGIVPLAQLPGEVLTNNGNGVTLSGTFAGDGAGLTNLNASNLATGTVANARLSTNVALLNTNATFAGNVTAQGNLNVGGQITGRQLNASSSPTPASTANEGQLYYNVSEKKLYYSNGTTWQPVESTRTYRWAVWSTYDYGGGWLCNNDSTLFGGVNPSNWSDGNATAQIVSSSKPVQAALFCKKAVVAPNSLVWAEAAAGRYPSSVDGRVAGALFRVRNTTTNAIAWNLCFYATYYGSWNEWASVAVNGVNAWTSGGGTSNPSGSPICTTLTIPPNRVSTVICISASGAYSGSSYSFFRSTVLAFYNNSLALPAGLEFVDDLDTASGGYEQ